MNALLWAFDAVVAAILVGLALLALTTADQFRSIVLFIAFGLVMAMAWARLQAVDIALAEAAIGAGLTGAMFLNALAGRRARATPRIRTGAPPGTDAPRARRRSTRVRRAAVTVVITTAGGLALTVGWGLWTVAWPFDGLTPEVARAMPGSGASNPVTAVLLNFRAYDTLLEVAVLLLATIGVWALRPATQAHAAAIPPGPVLMGLVYVLVPVAGVIGGYLLWVGTSAPGGAFQAGAVLAAIGVLLVVVGQIDAARLRGWRARALIVTGFVVFLAVGVSSLIRGAPLLEYPPRLAGPLILLIEALLTITIALVLAALFASGAATTGGELPTARSPGAAGARPRDLALDDAARQEDAAQDDAPLDDAAPQDDAPADRSDE